MKAEADRFFLQGVNQLIGHGWPYTPPGVAEPGWSFYAAAVFNDHNPWWIVMPDVTKYLQRVSYLLRQGKPANDVAVFLPNDDVYAGFKPGKVSLSDEMGQFVTPEITQQILGAGHNIDYIDAEAIKEVGIPYPVLVMPHTQRLSPETLAAIAAYVKQGGKVIAVGSTPDRGPGFLHAEAITAKVREESKDLFSGNPSTQVVARDEDLGAALRRDLAADVAFATDPEEIGFIHRKLEDADVYFVANTSNRPVKTSATFSSKRPYAASLNPFTGKAQSLATGPLTLSLAPYESRVIVISDAALPGAATSSPGTTSILVDLSSDWKITVPGIAEQTSTKLESWTDQPALQFYSGSAIYRKTLHLTADQLIGAKTLILDFGAGTPIPDPKARSGMRALLESPIREAAVVTVNGKRIGSVWHPPYSIDVTAALHQGDNTIELTVANTAINELSGRTPTDYRLLNSRYTERFTPQDMKNLEPLPSGILGPVHLLETR
jgi:hypothetical protein